ncbi:Uncharacterised protein [Mycobacteroides abscessus subsp. massiliense]|nr:Uncharacterised protein [Mycobacteroides abscessus subsp. massiliense]
MWWNSCAAASMSVNTLSVMRSCNRAAHCCFCPSVSAPSNHTAMPRSIRSMPSKPQFSAILVALEAQGEMVPKRGVTKNKCKPSRALGVCSTLCAASKACSFSTVAASSAFSLPTKYQNSLFNLTSGRPRAAAFWKSFSTRKSERAVTPRKGRTTDMDSAHKMQLGNPLLYLKNAILLVNLYFKC